MRDGIHYSEEDFFPVEGIDKMSAQELDGRQHSSPAPQLLPRKSEEFETMPQPTPVPSVMQASIPLSRESLAADPIA